MNFSRFLSDVLLMVFMNIKFQWDCIMGKKPVVQLWGCHDLHTADGEFVLKITVIAYVMYSTQTGVSLNWGHYIKGNQPLSKHAFIKIVNTPKVHRRTLKWFKVYTDIVESATLIYKSPNKILVCFTQNLVDQLVYRRLRVYSDRTRQRQIDGVSVV